MKLTERKLRKMIREEASDIDYYGILADNLEKVLVMIQEIDEIISVEIIGGPEWNEILKIQEDRSFSDEEVLHLIGKLQGLLRSVDRTNHAANQIASKLFKMSYEA